jgi:tetratricopeptide (TPR) repeat protein
MNEKITSALQKAQQERKRGQFAKAVKRLEQAIEMFPDELDLYLEAIDNCLDGGEVLQATNFLKTVQEKFTRDRDRVSQFVREKLQAVHDPSLARSVVEHAVKRRDLEAAIAFLEDVPDHTVRDLFSRAKTKMQSLKSATHGGYALRGEMVTNELTNALLSVRLGNMKEAMATLVKILEDKPVEYKMLDPFLASLEVKHPKSGRIRFARGCALRAAANEVDAIHRLVEAARLEQTCAPLCVDQLKAMIEHSRQAQKVQRALAEVLLIKGDLDDAAATLRDYLGTSAENAREIIMLVRPYIDPAHGLNACTWLAIDAALSIEQSSIALDILRPLQQRGGHGPALYEWLEAKTAVGFLSPDIMMFHGSLAIEQKQVERAAEVLGAVCTTSPQHVSVVLSIIDRHRSAHPALEALWTQHAPKETAEGEAASDDTSDFQMFENTEFKLEGAKDLDPAAPKPHADATEAHFAKLPPFSKPAAGAAPEPGGRRPLPKKTLMETQELSFDEDTPDAGEVTESHLNNVAQKLYDAGAAAFFHIDGGEPSLPAGDDAAPAQAAHARSERPAVAAGPPPAAEAPSPPSGVIELAAGSSPPGEPDPGDRLARIARAAEDGRLEELHELLKFEPKNGAEQFARHYYEAEYLALRNRPLQALEVLARLDAPGLGDEEKRRVWFKIAVCQRMTQNFAGANDTLRRLVELFPDNPEYARLKRRNDEQLLDEQGREATVLEKTSSLD